MKALIFLLLFIFTGQLWCQYAKVCDFTVATGSNPNSDIIVLNNKFYGTTAFGGKYYRGTIFKVNPDGTGYNVLHQFNLTDGNTPSSLLYYKDYLYGVTMSGGIRDSGVLYRLSTDGSNFQKLIDFKGQENGSYAYGSLIVINDTLYGRTDKGGLHNKGILYKVHISGSGFIKLFEFDSIHGSSPGYSLMQDGNLLFGTAVKGGKDNRGLIFRIDKDGNHFTKIFEFDSLSGNGPEGSLLILGDSIYAQNRLCIFKLNKNGSGFKIIKKLENTESHNGLMTADNTLFGTTFNPDQGYLFKIMMNTEKYDTLMSFSQYKLKYPDCTPVFYNNSVYGVTSSGGKYNWGAIFEYILKSVTPSIQASNITFSKIAKDRCTITWKRGNGRFCTIFMKQSNTGIAAPKDSFTYFAKDTLGNGSQIGSSGWFCIYKGSDTTIRVLGLSPNTDYMVMVCETGGAGGFEKYNTSASTENPGNIKTNNLIPQTINFGPISTLYGAGDYTIQATATSGLKITFISADTNIATIKNAQVHFKNSGECNITAFQPGDSMYLEADPVMQKLTINKATLTVTPDNKEKLLTDPDPVFTLSIKGFVKGETYLVLDSMPIAYRPDTVNDPGYYTIEAKGGKDNNYDFKYEKAMLTILKSALTQNDTKLVVYPNPASTIIHIELSDAGKYDINMIDNTGIILYSAEVRQNETTIDVSSLADGIYYLKITSSEENQIKQIIIQH